MIFSLAGLKFKTLAESATIHPKRLSSAFKFCCAKCRVEYKLIMDIVTWKQWCSQDALQFHVAAVKLPWNHELWSALICTDFNPSPPRGSACQMATKSGSLISETSIVIPGNNIRKKESWSIAKATSRSITHTQIKEWFVVKIPLRVRNDYPNCKQKTPMRLHCSIESSTHETSLLSWMHSATHVREEGWIPSRESSNYSTSQVLERYISLGLPYINELSSTCSTTPASRFLVPRVLLLWRCFFLIKALPPIFIPWRGQWGSVSSNFPPPLMTFPVPSSSSQPLEKSFASPKGLRCFVFLHQSVEQEYEQEYE